MDVLCVIHDDGHVCGLSSSLLTDDRLRFDHEVMVRIGVTGYRLERMDIGQALTAHLAGMDCATCHITLPCGCIAEHVAAGYCRHGTAKKMRRIGREVKAAHEPPLAT